MGNIGIGEPGWVIFAKRQLPWMAALDWAMRTEFFAAECCAITGVAIAIPTEPTMSVTRQPVSGLNEILGFILYAEITTIWVKLIDVSNACYHKSLTVGEVKLKKRFFSGFIKDLQLLIIHLIPLYAL